MDTIYLFINDYIINFTYRDRCSVCICIKTNIKRMLLRIDNVFVTYLLNSYFIHHLDNEDVKMMICINVAMFQVLHNGTINPQIRYYSMVDYNRCLIIMNNFNYKKIKRNGRHIGGIL